jgi:hypothetical protein
MNGHDHALTFWYIPAGSDNQHFTSASLLVLSNRCFSLTIGTLFALLLPSKDGSPLSVRERLLPKWPVSSPPTSKQDTLLYAIIDGQKLTHWNNLCNVFNCFRCISTPQSQLRTSLQHTANMTRSVS